MINKSDFFLTLLKNPSFCAKIFEIVEEQEQKVHRMVRQLHYKRDPFLFLLLQISKLIYKMF